METQKETPTKKFFIPTHVYKALERKAKAENNTPDQIAELLLLGAMISDHVPARCPHCQKLILIPSDGSTTRPHTYKDIAEGNLKNWESYRVRIPAE